MVETISDALTAVAMRKAAAKLIAGFRQQPEIARWLADLNLASAASPL